MKIRNFEESDVPELIRIHEQYNEEFGIEEFKQEFKCFFTVTTDDDKIVTVGGVRMIPEIVILTDKTAKLRDRGKSVRLIFQAIKFVSSRAGLTSLHAFIQEKNWLRVLLRKGFRLTTGTSIITDL